MTARLVFHAWDWGDLDQAIAERSRREGIGDGNARGPDPRVA